MRKKILFLIESLGCGGAEKALINYLTFIDHSRYEVTVCVISNSGPYVEEAKTKADHYVSILPNPAGIRGVKRLLYSVKYHLFYQLLPVATIYKKYIPKHNDVEIAFVEGFCTKILAASTNRSARKLCWVHCNMAVHHWTDSIFRNRQEEAEAYHQYDSIVTVSEDAKAAFASSFPLETPKLQLVHNPTNIVLPTGYIRAVHPSGPLQLVSVGRLESPKAFDRLLRAIQGLPVELQIVGDGSLRDELAKQISDLGETDQVCLRGFMPDPYPVVAKADLYVCSSQSEAYSSSVQEAVLLGTPVLTTDCAGMNEILHDGTLGMIVENSEEGLRSGLCTIIQDKTLLEQYRNAIREHIRQSSEKHDQLEAFYKLTESC